MFSLRDLCALFTWSRRTTCANNHGLFNLNYPQINEVGKSDHMVQTKKYVVHLFVRIPSEF